MCTRICGLAVAFLAAAACGKNPPSGPGLGDNNPNARITFTAGSGQSDTIQSTLTQALVVHVGAGPGGASSAHQVVRFQSVQDSGLVPALLQPLSGGTPSSFVAETTDASGETAAVVVLGTTTGPAWIAVSVPTFGYADTATYTVTPGNATGMQAAPNDTDAYVGNTVGIRTTLVDRFGNKRTDPVTFSLLSGPGGLQDRILTITGYGLIQIVGSAAGFTDTTTVYGVPTGTIAAASDVAGIYTFNLDGSNFKQISGVYAGTLKWAPNGQSLAFDQTVNGLYGATNFLETAQLNGQIATIVNSGGIALAYPQFSRDGQWIYFDEYSITQPMWRVHPDGTGDTTIFMTSPEGLQFPSPSSDGTQVSYILGSEIGDLKILTLSTGTAVDLGVKGFSDVWSPVGNVIAYQTLTNSLAIINSDGTGATTLAPGPYGPQFDWSPDGQWIIARNLATTRLELINVTTHLIIPLGYTGTIGSPTWH